MKHLFFCLFLLPLLAAAQDSCHLKRTKDDFTHQDKLSTGFVVFDANGGKVLISVDATAADVDFFFVLGDGKCFGPESTAQVNYDGDRLKGFFHNSGSMNCEGAFHLNFRNLANTPSNLDRFGTRRIKSIKFIGNGDVATEISFTDEQKQQLMRMAACVTSQAKGLIRQ